MFDGYVELYHTIRGQDPKTLKSTVINHYSNGTMKCAHCGEDDIIVLTIDHINNDGAAHRRQIGSGNTYHWLKKHSFPKGYQVLCRNCNFRKYIKSLEEA